MPSREVRVMRPWKGDTTILYTDHGDGLNLLLGEFGPEKALDACPAEMLPALARKVFKWRDVRAPSKDTDRMTALLRRRIKLEGAPYCVFRARDGWVAYAGAHAGESYSEATAACAVADCVTSGMDSGGAIPSITGFGEVEPEDIVTALHERQAWKIDQAMEHVARLSLLAPSSFPPWEWGFTLPVKVMVGDRKVYLVGPRESVEAGAVMFGGPNVMPRPAPLPPLYDFSEGRGYARLEYGPWKFEASDVLGLGRKFLHGLPPDLFPDLFHPQNLKRELAKRRAGEYRFAGCDAPSLGVPHGVLRRWLPLADEAPVVGVLYDAEVDLQGAEWSIRLEDGDMQVYGAGDHRYMRVSGEAAPHLLSMCSVVKGYDPLLGFDPVIRPELLPASWRGDIAARMPEWFSKQANYLRSLLTLTLRITEYGGKYKYMPLHGDESSWRAAVLRRNGSRWEMMHAAEAAQWARSGILSEAEELVVYSTSDIFMKEAIGKLTGRMELPWW